MEVKTISPEKGADKVQVKRAGNFNKLLVVKIDADFNFEARTVDRATLGNRVGKVARVSSGAMGGSSTGPEETIPSDS